MSAETESLLAEAVWVRSLARRLAVDAQRADDLAQDTWVAALKGGRGQGVPLRRWLAAVMRNVVRQDRRGESRRRAREAWVAMRSDAGTADPAPDSLVRLEGHRTVVEAVMGLHEPYRSAIVMRYFDNLAPRVIAERTGQPVRSVHTRLARALTLLRARLEGQHGDRVGGWLPFLGLLIGAEEPGGLFATTMGAVWMNAKIKLAAGAVALVGLAVVSRPLWTSAARPAASQAELRSPAALAEPTAPERIAAPSALQAESPREVVAVGTQSEPVPNAPPAMQVRTRVIDTDGSPLPGVALRYRGADGLGPTVLHTGADGALDVAFDSPAGALELEDDRWLVVLEPHSWSSGDAADNVMVLAARITLAGVVVDGEGQPLAEALVKVHLPWQSRSRLPTVLEFAKVKSWQAETDVTGAFEFECGVLPGGHLISRLIGYESSYRPQPRVSSYDLRLVLPVPGESAGNVRGHVVDAAGEPVEGARVALGLQHTCSDASGRFVLRANERDESGMLTALKPGLLPARLERAAESNTADGAWRDPLVLQLGGPPLAIDGRVIDGNGEAVAGAVVRLLDRTSFGPVELKDQEGFTMAGYVEPLIAGVLGQLEAKTDGSGRFHLKGLMPRAYRLAARVEERMLYVEAGPYEAGSSGVTLRLPADGLLPLLAGRVLNLAGDPLPGIRVTMMSAAEGDPLLDADPASMFGREIHGATVVSDDGGRFAFRDAPAAATHLSLSGASVGLGRRFSLGGESDLENIELRTPTVRKAQLDLSGSDIEADGFAVLGDREQPLMIAVSAGDMMFTTLRASIQHSRSNVFTVPETARSVVLYAGGEELLRLPVALTAGEVNVLRP